MQLCSYSSYSMWRVCCLPAYDFERDQCRPLCSLHYVHDRMLYHPAWESDTCLPQPLWTTFPFRGSMPLSYYQGFVITLDWFAKENELTLWCGCRCYWRMQSSSDSVFPFHYRRQGYDFLDRLSSLPLHPHWCSHQSGFVSCLPILRISYRLGSTTTITCHSLLRFGSQFVKVDQAAITIKWIA